MQENHTDKGTERDHIKLGQKTTFSQMQRRSLESRALVNHVNVIGEVPMSKFNDD